MLIIRAAKAEPESHSGDSHLLLSELQLLAKPAVYSSPRPCYARPSRS
jgi:hypothetical protein